MHANTSKLEFNGGKDHLIWRDGSGGTIEIYDIAVNSSRRTGIGRAMVETLKILNEGKKIFAITRKSNVIAHHFYEGVGFKLCAELPGLYEDEDARMYILYR